MSNTVTVTISYNRFEELAAKAEEACYQAVNDAADRIVSEALMLVPRSSGELAKSIRRETLGLGQAAAAAGDRRKAFYASMVEFGTVKTPARPFMTPAAEKGRQQFLDDLARLEERMK